MAGYSRDVARMDFRKLSHFVTVAETGSLTRAARRLNIVQPALSQSIAKLEQDLGAPLFTRSRHGMALTGAGELFLDSAQGILAQYDRARENLAAIGEAPRGLVSIAMTASALHVLTVPLVDAVAASFPGIALNLEEGLAATIQLDFDAGRYDLVVTYLAQRGGKVSIEPLIEEELFLVGAEGSLDEKATVDLAGIGAFPIILPQDRHGMRALVEEAAQASGGTLTLAPFSGSLYPTLDLVEAGRGFTLLPWSAIHDRIGAGRLAACPVTPAIAHTIGMAYPGNRPLTQAGEAVMDALRAILRREHEARRWRGRLLLA